MRGNTPFNREQIAWAAGLFEGEGCFCWSKGKRSSRRLCLQLTMTDEDVVRKFHGVVGVGRVYGPFTHKNSKWKPRWVWQTTTFEHAQFATALLWSWLCSRRRSKASEVLTRYLSTVVEKRKHFAMNQRLSPDEVREIRALRADGMSQASLARRFQRSQPTISLVVHGKRHASVGEAA